MQEPWLAPPDPEAPPPGFAAPPVVALPPAFSAPPLRVGFPVPPALTFESPPLLVVIEPPADTPVPPTPNGAPPLAATVPPEPSGSRTSPPAHEPMSPGERKRKETLPAVKRRVFKALYSNVRFGIRQTNEAELGSNGAVHWGVRCSIPKPSGEESDLPP